MINATANSPDKIILAPAPVVPMLSSIEELAALLQVPVKTIYYWVHRKQIPYIKMGRHLRFKPEEVLATFVEKTEERSAPCVSRQAIIKKSGNRSFSFKPANPPSTKE